MNKTIIGIIIAVVVIVGGVYLMTRTPNTTQTTSNTGSNALSTAQQNQAAVTQGRVVFAVTDTAVDMNTISEINMQVNSVDVHSTTTGWTTVSTTPHTYSLLMLNAKNQSELLADTNISAGTYDQIRLIIDSISVKTKTGVTKAAKLPSGELKINTTLVVNANGTSSVNFDFLADKSLHLTGNGDYIFAPVVKTETKSGADVSVDANNVVTVANGKSDNSNTEGMDIDGSVKVNFQLKTDEKLDVVDGAIKIHDILNTNIPKTSNVSITNLSFNPTTLTIKTGTKITWTNNDTVSHTVTSDSGNLFNSGTLSPGQSFSFTFTDTGTVNYHCSIHPTMKSKIIVQK